MAGRKLFAPGSFPQRALKPTRSTDPPAPPKGGIGYHAQLVYISRKPLKVKRQVRAYMLPPVFPPAPWFDVVPRPIRLLPDQWSQNFDPTLTVLPPLVPGPGAPFDIQTRKVRTNENWDSPVVAAKVSFVAVSFDVTPYRQRYVSDWVYAGSAPVILPALAQPFDVKLYRQTFQPGWDIPEGATSAPTVPFTSEVDPPFVVVPYRSKYVDWPLIGNPAAVLAPLIPGPGQPFEISITRPQRNTWDWVAPTVVLTPVVTQAFDIAVRRPRSVDWAWSASVPALVPVTVPAFDITARKSTTVIWDQLEVGKPQLPVVPTVPLPWYDVVPRSITVQAKFASWWNDSDAGNPAQPWVPSRRYAKPKILLNTASASDFRNAIAPPKT